MGNYFSTVRKQFEAQGQGHVYTFWDDLDKDERQVLLHDLASINIESINNAFKSAITYESSPCKMTPLPTSMHFTTSDNANVDDWRTRGMAAISEGQVAVIVLAGGQGTRLGSSAPKGCFDIGLPSKKTIFQLQAERIIRLQYLASEFTGKICVIPWYIMTSNATRYATQSFFHEHDFFGLSPQNVTFFCQESLPAFTEDGNIIMESKCTVSFAPNGNGGMYKSLDKTGILDDMEKRGVKYVHAYSVDNALVKVADPVFMGFGIVEEADCAAKSVKKVLAAEPVGIICLVDEKPALVEYSEMDDKSKYASDGSGNLTYNLASIANLFYTVDFLKRMATVDLKYHVARKTIPCIDLQNGTATTCKGVKLELFNVDVFRLATNFKCLEVPRKEEFAPVKNKVGGDSPETSRNAILEQGKRWIKAAGATVNHGVNIEVSPLKSYYGEGLDYVKGCVVGYDQIFE